MNQQEELFTDELQGIAFDQYSASEEPQRRNAAQGGLWQVEDDLANDQTMRFQRGQSVITELIYENGAEPLLSGVRIPKGLTLFLEKVFLPPLGLTGTKWSPVEKILKASFHYLDWEEPYFFLVDMPISLDQDCYKYTYRVKRNGTILDPSQIETFSVQRAWNFPHYARVHQIVTDHRTTAVCRGDRVWSDRLQKHVTRNDILEMICNAVYGSLENLVYQVENWMEQYFVDATYDQRNHGPDVMQELSDARENDFELWMAVSLGMFTWLKSPHGLKFLTQFHPFYYELLDWDEDKQKVVIRSDSGGWAVASCWSIYTARDVERLQVEPGTCCVAQVPLHCTKRVNSKAIMTKCHCGKPRRFDTEEYWLDRDREHLSSLCQKWEEENPPHMVFVSYGALNNILSGVAASTPKTCPRTSCPKKTCVFHAAPHLSDAQTKYLRIRELTEQRTMMLTGGGRV